MGLPTLTGKYGALKTQPDDDFWIVISYPKYNEEAQESEAETGLHATYSEKCSSGW